MFNWHCILLLVLWHTTAAGSNELIVSCTEAEKISRQYATYLEIDVGNYSHYNHLKINMNGFNLMHSIGRWGDASIEFRMFFRKNNSLQNDQTRLHFYCKATPNAVIGLKVINNGKIMKTYPEKSINKFSGREQFNLNLQIDAIEKSIIVKREQTSWEALGNFQQINLGQIYRVEVETFGPIQINELCARETAPEVERNPEKMKICESQNENDNVELPCKIPQPNIAENDEHNATIEKIQEAGNNFSYPYKYSSIKPIEETMVLTQWQKLEYKIFFGFHFADVIGYTKTKTVYLCYQACAVYESCTAANYVHNTRWCVLSKTGHVHYHVTHLWGQNDHTLSTHIFYMDARKQTKAHVPRNDGAGVLALPGVIPESSRNTGPIIGGKEPYAYPWIVKLKIGQNMNCAGAFLTDRFDNEVGSSSRFVVTPAHCLSRMILPYSIDETYDPPPMVLLANYRNDMVTDPEQIVKGLKVVINGYYALKPKIMNDIALIQLEQPVEFNNYIRPIRLPDNNSWPTHPTLCKTAGWGARKDFKFSNSSSSVLEEIKVSISFNDTCDRNLDEETMTTQNQFCARPIVPGDAICFGDSGGPLFCPEYDDNGVEMWTLYGLSSYASEPYTPIGNLSCLSHPPMFANVSSLHGWLVEARDRIESNEDYSVDLFP